MPKTKIICTIGPASTSLHVLREMARAGMDVARLNFSHGDFSEHLLRYHYIRRVSAELGRQIGVLQDLPGPKIRIGDFAGGSVKLLPGRTFTLTTTPCTGDENRVYIGYPRLTEFLQPGQRVMLDDGNIQLRVQEVLEKEVACRVEIGGELKGRKGAVFPDSDLPLPSITEEDRKALEFGAQLGVDMVAVSFARSPENIEDVRKILGERGVGQVQVIAKIEERQGLRNLGSLLEVSDGIMVARGDLGVSVPREEVPLLQERIIKSCRREGKPVVVATQMLESMVSQPTPTRAEVTDVALASLQGADALMLSAETAVGKYPVEAVKEMSSILQTVEASPEYLRVIRGREGYPAKPSIEQALCRAIDELSEAAGVRGIILSVASGRMLRILSAYRPAVPIYAIFRNETQARSFLLWWGVEPVVGEVEDVLQQLKERGELGKGERVLLCGDEGTPFGKQIKLFEI
ncbi:MAG: pyruvate kinase [Candidatus Hadarchaeales archaeon]